MEERQRAFLVTGGAGGIGSAIVEQLVNYGHIVTVVDRIPSHIENVGFIQADCEASGAMENAITDAMAERDYDGVVNAIGYYGCQTLETFSWAECEKSWMINARAPVEAILTWAKLRDCSKHGVAVNISSAAARLGSRDLSYSMSKAAIEGATRSLARSLASFRVTVLCVAPGLIDTPMSDAMPPERRSQHVNATLMKRPGRPEEIADAVVFVLLGKSEYLSGSTLNISCGMVW